MNVIIRSMLSGAATIEKLPGATFETCGAYMEHDYNSAISEIKRLVIEGVFTLENPPLLDR